MRSQLSDGSVHEPGISALSWYWTACPGPFFLFDSRGRWMGPLGKLRLWENVTRHNVTEQLGPVLRHIHLCRCALRFLISRSCQSEIATQLLTVSKIIIYCFLVSFFFTCEELDRNMFFFQIFLLCLLSSCELTNDSRLIVHTTWKRKMKIDCMRMSHKSHREGWSFLWRMWSID